MKHARLALLSTLAGCLFFVFCGILIAWYAYIDWSTCGHVYAGTDLGRRMGQRRIMFLAIISCLSVFLSSLGVLCYKFELLSPRLVSPGGARARGSRKKGDWRVVERHMSQAESSKKVGRRKRKMHVDPSMAWLCGTCTT